jgi:UDP-N-acetylmuramoyl-L-alanyl-D-glutamate--2,6-diaminopimelate ligase
MKLKELLNGFKYRLEMGSLDTDVSDIIYDSRKIKKGCIFVCLIGSKIDAHKFSEDAVKKGANVIVASREIKVDNCTVIKVNDTRYAMACMSAAYFSYPAKRLKTVGITGTKGKTTTTAMVKNILETAGVKTGTIGTLGVLYGDKVIKTNNTTPESYDVQKYLFDMVNDGCKAAILEASSLGLKWHRVGGFVFDYGVFTNFSSDHIGEDEQAMKNIEFAKACCSKAAKQVL